MSTTAGVGAGGTYRAVNPLAVAAAVLAVLSLGVFVHPLLLAVPAAGVVTAAAAFVAVRRSNGTQVGIPLAAAALVVCLGLTIAFGVRIAAAAAADRRMAADVRASVETFGRHLAAGEYNAAYDMTAEAFRNETGRSAFATFLAGYPTVRDSDGVPVFGDFTAARAGPRMRFGRGAGGRATADLEFIVGFAVAPELSQRATLVETPAGWRVRSFERWFAS